MVVLHILLGMHVDTCGIQNRQHRQKEKQSSVDSKEHGAMAPAHLHIRSAQETAIHRLLPL